MTLHVSSTCALHQKVKIALHSLWYHHTYRWPCCAQVERGLSPDDEHMCPKHVEAWNKLTVKQKFCASSWLITGINIEYLLLDRELSTRQEVGVINVKYHCHKATRTLNVTQTPDWLTQLSYTVDSKLYSDFCIARDCFMILMPRSFQFNALSRGNQRPNLPYK